MYERKLTLEEADKEQSNLVNELKDIDRDVKPLEKRSLNNVGLFIGAREKVLNEFKNRILPIKDKIIKPEPEPEPTPEATPESASESHQNQHQIQKYLIHLKLSKKHRH